MGFCDVVSSREIWLNNISELRPWNEFYRKVQSPHEKRWQLFGKIFTVNKVIKDEKRDLENFVAYVEDYFQLTPSDGQKGIRELHQDFKKQKSHGQEISHRDFFWMSIYKHINGLASTIEFRCNRKKQDNRLSNYHFSLHITQQTIHHSGDPRYAASKWYSINFQ